MKARLCICVTALAAALLAGGWLMGDDKKTDDPPKAKGQLPAHFKKLGLTDKQIKEIYKIEAEYHEKVVALQQQIDDLKRAEHLDVDNVLTEEQKAHLRELLTAEVPEKDKTTPPVTDKPAPPPDKDKGLEPAPKDKPTQTDKDKPTLIDKDKAPPAKDK